MRWIFFLVLAWLLTAVQSTVAGVLSIELGSIGTIAPDMLASLAAIAASARRVRSAAPPGPM